MTQELTLKSASQVQTRRVSVHPVEQMLTSNQNSIHFHSYHHAGSIIIGGSPWKHNGFNSSEIGVMQLSETGTLYDALAEIEVRGFMPAYGCELLSLWCTDNKLWHQHEKIIALADAETPVYRQRFGAEITYMKDESFRTLLNNHKWWQFWQCAWDISNFTPLIEKNTALAVTKPRGDKSFLSSLTVKSNSELQLIRMAQMRAQAKFAGGPNADAVVMNSMIVSLLAEISSNLSQIPDMARQLEELNDTVKAGAVLNYNEQVDIYNKLVDIKDIMLNRYKED